MTAVTIRKPPGAPTVRSGRSSLSKTRVLVTGHQVILPGPGQFGESGRGLKDIMLLLSRIPVPGTITREPNREPSVWSWETMLRSLSTTCRWVVCWAKAGLSIAPGGTAPGGAVPSPWNSHGFPAVRAKEARRGSILSAIQRA